MLQDADHYNVIPLLLLNLKGCKPGPDTKQLVAAIQVSINMQTMQIIFIIKSRGTHVLEVKEVCLQHLHLVGRPSDFRCSPVVGEVHTSQLCQPTALLSIFHMSQVHNGAGCVLAGHP